MQFCYHEKAGETSLALNRGEFTHLFKVRRVKEGSTLFFRNMRDGNLYTYQVSELGRREALLNLLSKESKAVMASHALNVGWSVVDPKTVEKTLPMLNEMGVAKIAFVYTDFSQSNFKPDFERLQRIVINSSQQCGRSHLMEFEVFETLEEYLNAYPECVVIDFSSSMLSQMSEKRPSSLLVGCEGGFSDEERTLFTSHQIVGFDTPLILRSESAVTASVAKILL